MADRKIGAGRANSGKRPAAKGPQPSSRQGNVRVRVELLFWLRRAESLSARGDRFQPFSFSRPQQAAH